MPTRTVAILSTCLAVLGLLFAQLLASPPSHAAPLAQTTVVTWNMQGGSDGYSSKYSLVVQALAAQAPVVMLQEAGPLSGVPGATVGSHVNGRVTERLWQAGSNSRAQIMHVYFLDTDPTGHRVTTAIVTRQPADEVTVVDNPVTNLRAAVGVRFGNDWYFSYHAAANGGNDAGGMLTAIDNFVRGSARPSATWTVGADFNRDPSRLTVPNGAQRYTTGRATQQGSGELDYIVTRNNQGNLPTRIVEQRLGASDHYPVRVGAMQATAGWTKMDISLAPTGDQITEGLNDSAHGGYRSPLLDALGSGPLSGAFGKRDYVGSTRNSTFADPDDEAYDNATVDDLYSRIAPAAYNGPNRQVVFMLHAGTNDLRTTSAATSAAGRRNAAAASADPTAGDLERLIDKLLAYGSNKTVVVATLVPNGNADIEARIAQYNTDVRALVQRLQHDGDHVVLADMSDVTTADLADGTLPNPAGYQKMADAYNEAIAQAYFSDWIMPPGTAAGRSCDIYGSYGTPCTAAHSMVRALYAAYNGPLYQVQRASDRTTADITVRSAGGIADAAAQDAFCANTSCTITKIYDQSPMHNDLTVEGKGSAGEADHPADASALPVTLDGTKVYGLDVTGQVGYRNNATQAIATNGAPEGMYMVASGTHVNDGCCFDYGNAEPSTTDTGNGHMDAVNLGTECYFPPCSGSGPWVEADLENGLFSGANGSNLANKGNSSNFVTALLKNNGQTNYAIKGGDAQQGGLSTWWDGALPDRGGYRPMQQEGAIVLGTGGDNSNRSIGSWFEGVMTQGYPSDDADNAVQADITAAKYDGNSAGTITTSPPTAGQAVVHDGYSSVYSVDAANGHLQETYLTKLGDPWSTQDLSAKYGTPPVLPGTQPVALTHGGYTSVFTVDAGSNDLQETYLSGIGADWITQDLTTKYHAPVSDVTPTALLHDGYTSLYTADANGQQSGDLQETYLTAIGQPWQTQDLSANYGTPKVLAGTSPVALFHGGYASVYTVDADNHHVQETYLTRIGASWTSQDLSAKYGTPPTITTPGAVVHDGYTSVYTIDDPSNDLQETYLANIGAPWATQDLSSKYGTPHVAPGTHPVAMVHTGYTSVYTTDQSTDDVQETYLSGIGANWISQDFTTKYGTPTTAVSPVPLLHPNANGAMTWSSVFTFDEFNDHLQETFLPAINDAWTSKDLSAQYGTPPALESAVDTAQWSATHSGYTSVFTVDKSNNHLRETFLTAMGKPWQTQDLTAKYGTPAVRARTIPVVVVHDGYTSVFTVDAGSNDLQETYLSGIGANWITQDLTTKYKVPAVATLTSPSAVHHNGFVHVFTVDADNHDLQETSLSLIGADWITQDLTSSTGAPAVIATSSPAAVSHSGWLSVFTIDSGTNHLQETYLPTGASSWITQDISAKYSTPAAENANSPAAVVHSGWTSVYTVDGNGHLQETYLPGIGDAWITQDLSAKFGTPAVATANPPVPSYHTGYTSVYTVNAADNHVVETYLPAIGANWATQDFTTKYGTPPADQAPTAVLHYDTAGGLTYTSVFSVSKADQHLDETYLPAIGNNWTEQDLSTKYGVPPV